MRERPRRRHRWLPRPTVRLRLTLLYGSLFLVAGALLLGITYGLAAKNVSDSAKQVFVLKGALIRAAPGPGGSPKAAQQSGTVSSRVVPYFAQGGANVTTALPAGLPAKLRPTAEALQVAANESVHQVRKSQLSALLTESAIALVIMAFVSIGLGWLVAGRVLAPVRMMNARVRQITEHSLHERLALSGHDDELKELGDTFDELLARLERAFESQRLFVANASHELRTPVTVERALVEVALADPDATVESLRDTCGRVLVAGQQQERTIEALLTLARSQRGIAERESFDLADLTRRVLASRRADIRRRRLHLDLRLEPAPTSGEPRLAERLIANLVDNAIRHNHRAGLVQVATRTAAGAATISVANSGPIVPPEEVARLLEPFERLTGARRATADGSGLGLSIAAAIARAHGGALVVEAQPEGGLAVRADFPAPQRTPRPLAG